MTDARFVAACVPGLVVLLLLVLPLPVLLLYCIHAIYWSPLKDIPGPKIAAVTRLYEFYHNAIRPYKYGEHIERLHARYGPIVRINPSEVHIQDAHFHATFESTHPGVRKDAWIYNVGLNGATGLIIDERAHRIHRSNLLNAIQPKLAAEVASVIQRLGAQLMRHLNENPHDTFNASDAVRSLGHDFVSAIFLGGNGGLLSTRDLGHSFLKQCRGLFQLAAWHRQFPFLGTLARAMPDCFVKFAAPNLPLERSVSRLVTTLLEYPNYRDNPSVVEALGSSHHEISRSDIIDEALEGVFGGTEAIGHASTNIAFHLAKDQHIRANLRQELNAGAFHPGMAPNAVISKFPYLMAVFKEGLRTERGNYYRFARVCPYDIKYRGYILPAGTVISMCPKDTHEDESVFREPSAFKPERWLGSDAQHLNKYLMTFGQGKYKCLGIELAKMVILYTLARLIYEYDFELAMEETVIHRDGCLDAFPPWSSGGLRLRFTPVQVACL